MGGDCFWSCRLLLFLPVFLLGGLFGAMSQELPSTKTVTQSDWVILEKERWDELTRLGLVLETRLMQRVTQAAELQELLKNSQASIDRLTESEATLARELKETQRSYGLLQTFFDQERLMWQMELEETVIQRDSARNQRDSEARRASELDQRNRLNKIAWHVGVPMALIGGFFLGREAQ